MLCFYLLLQPHFWLCIADFDSSIILWPLNLKQCGDVFCRQIFLHCILSWLRKKWELLLLWWCLFLISTTHRNFLIVLSSFSKWWENLYEARKRNGYNYFKWLSLFHIRLFYLGAFILKGFTDDDRVIHMGQWLHHHQPLIHLQGYLSM